MQAYLVLKTLIEKMADRDLPLREINEKLLPKFARKLKAKEGDYYEMLLRFLEQEAELANISPFKIRTEEELLLEIAEFWKKRKN